MKDVIITKEQLAADNEKLKARVTELEKLLVKPNTAELPIHDVYQNVRTAISHLQEGFFKIDLGGNLLLYNKEFLTIFGLDPNKEPLGLNFVDFWQNRDERKDYVNKIRKNGYVRNYVIKAKMADGEPVSVSVSAWLVVEEDGTSKAIMGSCVDITQNLKLQESYQKSELILKTTSDVVITTTTGGEILSWNKGAEKILGYSQNEVIGENIRFLFQKNDIPFLEKLLVDAAKLDNIDGVETNLINSGHQKITLLVSVSNIKDNDGNVKELVGIGKPIGNIKLATEAIRLSQQHYQTLFENAPGPIWIEDYSDVYAYFEILQKRGIKNVRKFFNDNPGQLTNCLKRVMITDVNKATLKLFGVKNKDAFTGNLARIFTDKTIDVFKEGIIKLASGSMEFDAEAEVKTLRGKKKYIYFKLLIEKEEPDYYKGLVSAIDITEKKQKDLDLQKSEKKYRDLFEKNQAGIFRSTLKGEILECNEEYTRIFGYASVEEMKTVSTKTIYPNTKDRQKLMTILKKNKELKNVTIKLKKKDGSFVWVQDNISLIYDDDRKEEVIFGTMIDITKQKNSERELRRSEEKYRLLTENAFDVIWKMDMMFKFTYISPSVFKMLGFDNEDLIGQPLAKLVSPDEFLSITKVGLNFIKNYKTFSPGIYETVLLNKSGNERNIELTIRLLLNESGLPIGFQGSARDITERKKAEQELILSEKKYNSLFQTMDEGVGLHEMLYDENGIAIDYKLLEVNKAFQTHTGMSSKSVIGKKATVLYKETPYIEIYDKVIKSGKPELFETYYEPLKKHFSFSAVRLWGNKFATIFRDITERKRIENELVKNEEKYRSIFENIQDVYYETTLDGTILEISSSVENVSGGKYHRQDLLGKSMYGIYFDPKERDELIAQLKKSGSISDYEVQLKNNDGSSSYCSITAKLGLDSNGKAEKIIGSLHDISERKQAEEYLKESEKRYRDIFSFAPVGILQATPEGKFITINDRLVEILGYDSKDELIKKNLSKDIYYDKQERKRLIEKYEPFGSVFNREVRWKRKNGDLIWISLSSHAVRDENGKTIYFEAFVEDITNRKQAEESLKENERFLTETQKIARLGSYVLDIRSGLWKGSEVLDSIFGIDENYDKSINGWVSFIHPDWQKTMEDYMTNEVLGRKKKFDKEYKIIRKIDGEERWVHGTGELVFDKNKKPVKMVGSIIDITDRKNAELALKESEERYRLISEVSSDYVFSTKVENDGSLTLDWVSGAFEQMTGFSFEEYNKKHGWINSIHPDSQKQDESDMEQLYKNKKVVSELLTIKKDGSYLWVESSAHPVWDERKNRLVGIYGSVRDITERILSEKTLLESENKYRSLFEKSADAMFLLSKGSFIDCNPAALKMFGVTKKEEILNLHPSKVSPPLQSDGKKSFDKANALMKKAFRKGSNRFEWLHKRMNGEVFWTEVLLTTIPFGNQLFIHTIVRDISDRKQAETAVQESELRYRQLVELSPDAIAIHRDGRFIFVNNSAVKMFKAKSKAEVIGKPILERVHPDYYKTITNRINNITDNKSKNVPIVEEKFIRFDGTVFDAEVAATNFSYEGKKAVQVIVRDITERKKASEALKESERKLDTLINNVQGIVYRCKNDKNWSMEFLSAGFETITGYKLQDFLNNKNLSFADLILPEDRERVWYEVQQALENGQKFSVNYRIKSASKEIHHVLEKGTGIYSEDGSEVIALEGLISDITQQTKIEEALRVSEELNRSITQTAADAIITIDSKGIVFSWNQAAEQIFGYTRNEMLNTELIEIVPDHLKTAHRQGLAHLNGGGETKLTGQTFEIEAVRKNGHKFSIELSLSQWESKYEKYYTGIIRDITERKEFENALLESESKYRFLFDNSNDGIYLLYNRKFEMINKKFVEMFGYAQSEMNKPGFDFIQLVADKSKKFVENRYKKIANNEDLQHKYEFTAISKDGRELEVEASVSFIPYKDGLATQGIIRDISERKRQQEVLMNTIIQVQEEEKRNFGKELHDGLGQTLTSMSLYLESFRKISENLPEEKQSDLDHARKLNKQAISDARKISHGLMVNDIENQKIVNLIRQLCHDSSTPSTQFSCYFRNTRDLVISRDLRLHLYRIAQELTTNILRHSRASKAKIWLSVIKDESLRLIVSDNGKGISKKARRNSPGAGLVNVSQRIALCKGTLKIESKKGVGTKFIMTVPL